MREVLILSAGMPRAGSGWHYNLIHDLVVASGGEDARSIRKQYHLQRYLTEINCNISTLNPHRLLPVFLPALMGNKFAIKTHAGPSMLVHWLQRKEAISIIYIFRDPRAAMLSAYEYGRRALANNRPNAFSQLTTLDSAGDFMNLYIRIWRAWSKLDGILLVRYEDLVHDFDVEIERLMEYLGMTFNNGDAEPVLYQYRPERGNAERKGTHFSKGQVERFRDVFTSAELERFTTMFEPDLGCMGYSK
ncbi:sulfotransferase domain-containing protein [Chloroflexota bacterium]